MIDQKNFIDQSVKDSLRTYESNAKIATGHRHDYTNGCLLDHSFFKENYKLLAIDLSKQQAFGVHPKSNTTN